MSKYTTYVVSPSGFETRIGSFDTLAAAESCVRDMSQGTKVRIEGGPERYQYGVIGPYGFEGRGSSVVEDALETAAQKPKRSIVSRVLGRSPRGVDPTGF